MGKVVVAARIENLGDLYAAERDALPSDQVRTIEPDDCLVDTGATMLSLPRPLIDRLGLRQHRQRKARTAGGELVFGIYDAVRLTIQGRDCVVEVCEIAADCPLIGQIPLEALDFVVDPAGQRLIGNPDHHGEHMIDVFNFGAYPKRALFSPKDGSGSYKHDAQAEPSVHCLPAAVA